MLTNKSFKYVIFIILFSIPSLSQELKFNVSADTNNVLIGEHIKLNIEVKSDKTVNINFPIIPDTLGNLEIISRSTIDTLKDKGFNLRQTLMVTSFDSGSFVFPALIFFYQKKGSFDQVSLTSDSILLRFKSVAVDTTKDFKDIKPILEEPVTLDEYLKYIYIALIIIVASALGFYLWKKFKSRTIENIVHDPKIPAHIIAIESLKQLDNDKLWQKGEVKRYYIRLTDIIRTYIEKRFDFPAMEMTTPEILNTLEPLISDTKIIISLSKTLELADLVKFAKYHPLSDENSSVMSICFDFVNFTKPEQNVSETNKEESI